MTEADSAYSRAGSATWVPDASVGRMARAYVAGRGPRVLGRFRRRARHRPTAALCDRERRPGRRVRELSTAERAPLECVHRHRDRREALWQGPPPTRSGCSFAIFAMTAGCIAPPARRRDDDRAIALVPQGGLRGEGIERDGPASDGGWPTPRSGAHQRTSAPAFDPSPVTLTGEPCAWIHCGWSTRRRSSRRGTRTSLAVDGRPAGRRRGLRPVHRTARASILAPRCRSW